MHERHEHAARAEPGVAAEQVEAVATDPYARRRGAASKARQAIYLLFGVVEGLIAIRFVLRALGANPEAGFAAFVYGATAPFLAPFVGLFGTPRYNGSALELHAVVAIAVYALLAWALARLAWLLLGETRSAVRTRASRVDADVP